MTWWNSLVSFLRSLPIAQYIKPLWKGALKALVGAEVAQLRPQLKEAAARGPKAVDAAFAAFEARLADGIAKLPLPAAVLDALQAANGALDTQLDHARMLLDMTLEQQGPSAVDAALDTAAAALAAKIDAL